MLTEIDLRPSARPGTSREVATAIRQGVFVVKHSIPSTVLDDAYGKLSEFFACEPSAKSEWRIAGTNGQTGYTPPMVETAERANVPDWKELFHWGVDLPDGHPLRRRYPNRYPESVWPERISPGIGTTLVELHEQMLKLQLSVLDVIGSALGVGPDFFRDMLAEGPVVNRASYYPPMAEAPGEGQTWAVAHKDFDLVTALPRATAPGLEVELDGEWIPVAPTEGYAVVNAGMALERLSNGVIPAALHRVIAQPAQQEGRLSIVQFCHATPWTSLNPLSLPEWGAGSPRFSTMNAQDLFERTMFRINRLSDQP